MRNRGVGRKMFGSEPRQFGIPRTVDLALASSMAGIYIVSTFFPVSPFIGGGPGFITLEIVMLPVIAFLLRPVLATTTVFIGSLGMALGQPSYYQVFGLLGFLIPIITVAIGSAAFHYRLGPIFPWAFVQVGALFYITFSQGGTLFWLVPYTLVTFSLPLALRFKGRSRLALTCLYTAMTEQAVLNILSIGLLGLVGPVWAVITPFMYGERALATMVGSMTVVALKSGMGTTLDLKDPVFTEVRL
jgi:hypothetical protein